MSVQIIEDGTTLTGSEWIRASDYDNEADELGLLRSMKGATPTEWPSLDSERLGDDGPLASTRGREGLPILPSAVAARSRESATDSSGFPSVGDCDSLLAGIPSTMAASED